MKNESPGYDLMTMAAAARYLGVHHYTLKAMVLAGEVPAYQVRERWRFKRSDLDAVIKPVKP